MPVQQKQTKATSRRYSPEFKVEALGLAEQVGVAGAAKQSGLHKSQLYAWRKKARYEASRNETKKQSAFRRLFVTITSNALAKDLTAAMVLKHLQAQAKKRSGSAANNDRKSLAAAWN